LVLAMQLIFGKSSMTISPSMVQSSCITELLEYCTITHGHIWMIWNSSAVREQNWGEAGQRSTLGVGGGTTICRLL
jgi:hypothetical protein